MGQFSVGDIVIGNDKANQYSCTTKNSIIYVSRKYNAVNWESPRYRKISVFSGEILNPEKFLECREKGIKFMEHFSELDPKSFDKVNKKLEEKYRLMIFTWLL
jgi:hypothetical protein